MLFRKGIYLARRHARCCDLGSALKGGTGSVSTLRVRILTGNSGDARLTAFLDQQEA